MRAGEITWERTSWRNRNCWFIPLLGQPTLIMSGDDDPIIPLANARLMHRLIRGSLLHVYQGGHLSLVTEAAQLAPVVERFLATADGGMTQADRRRRRTAAQGGHHG